MSTTQIQPPSMGTAVTDEQRQQDMQIRLEQAESRRAMDSALRAAGRCWSSDACQHEEAQFLIAKTNQECTSTNEWVLLAHEQ